MNSIKNVVTNTGQSSKRYKILYSDLTATTTTFDINLPPGALVENIDVVVTTVFNAATSAVVTLGDPNDADYWLTSTDVKTAVVSIDKSDSAFQVAKLFDAPTDDDRTVRLTLTYAGTAPTTGELWFTVHYAFLPNTVNDRSTE